MTQEKPDPFCQGGCRPPGSQVTLKGALWSEDTEAMVDCMKRLLAQQEDQTAGANPTVFHLKDGMMG